MRQRLFQLGCLVCMFALQVAASEATDVSSLPEAVENQPAQVADSKEPHPEAYLIAIGQALRNLDFKGVFTYEQAGQTTAQQWVHLVRDGVEHERLLGLDGAHREVLRERPAGCLMRGAQGIQSHLSSVLAGEGVTSLQDYYALSMGKQEVVAGRAAQVVQIMARDAFRYSYRLLVDRDTQLLLGADMLDVEGGVIERFRFLSIFVGPVSEADLDPVTAAPVKLDMAQCEFLQNRKSALPVEPGAVWQVDLPPGYALCHQERREQDKVREDVQMYSDGITHFTLFIRHEGVPEQDGQLQRGNTLLRSQVIELQGRFYTVTVVGEIPGALARFVLGGIRQQSVIERGE